MVGDAVEDARTPYAAARRSGYTAFSAVGSVVGAGAMGYVLDHGGMMSALALTLGSMLLTALLTLPFLRSPAVGGPQAAAAS